MGQRRRNHGSSRNHTRKTEQRCLTNSLELNSEEKRSVFLSSHSRFPLLTVDSIVKEGAGGNSKRFLVSGVGCRSPILKTTTTLNHDTGGEKSFLHSFTSRQWTLVTRVIVFSSMTIFLLSLLLTTFPFFVIEEVHQFSVNRSFVRRLPWPGSIRDHVTKNTQEGTRSCRRSGLLNPLYFKSPRWHPVDESLSP